MKSEKLEKFLEQNFGEKTLEQAKSKLENSVQFAVLCITIPNLLSLKAKSSLIENLFLKGIKNGKEETISTILNSASALFSSLHKIDKELIFKVVSILTEICFIPSSESAKQVWNTHRSSISQVTNKDKQILENWIEFVSQRIKQKVVETNEELYSIVAIYEELQTTLNSFQKTSHPFILSKKLWEEQIQQQKLPLSRVDILQSGPPFNLSLSNLEEEGNVEILERTVLFFVQVVESWHESHKEDYETPVELDWLTETILLTCIISEDKEINEFVKEDEEFAEILLKIPQVERKQKILSSILKNSAISSYSSLALFRLLPILFNTTQYEGDKNSLSSFLQDWIINTLGLKFNLIFFHSRQNIRQPEPFYTCKL